MTLMKAFMAWAAVRSSLGSQWGLSRVKTSRWMGRLMEVASHIRPASHPSHSFGELRLPGPVSRPSGAQKTR